MPVPSRSTSDQVDLAALRAAVTARTRLLFLATPEQPDRPPRRPRDELIAFVRDLPEHVLPVIDEAYFDFLEPDDRLDTIADLVRTGARRARAEDVLEALRARGPAGRLRRRAGRGRRGDAQGAARLRRRHARPGGGAREPRRRRTRSSGAAPRTGLRSRRSWRCSRRAASSRSPGSVTNFVLVDVGADADDAAARASAAGVAVQSGMPFGAPTSLRIGAGSPDDLALLDAALGRTGLGARQPRR